MKEILAKLTAYPFVRNVGEVIKRKPAIFFIVSLAYLVGAGFLKWQIRPPVWALAYLAGGLLGVYFLDIAEVFFHLTPSPFRSIVFAALFVVVSLFVVTSSGSFLATGLVLSLYLCMVLWQVGEWQLNGNLNQWYKTMASQVPVSAQRWAMVAFVGLFIFETILFIR